MENKKTIKDTILVYLENSKKKSFSVKDISESLGLTNAADFKLLVGALAKMEQEGAVELNKKGHFKLPKEKPGLEGIFRANDRGFGFVSIEDEDDDVYIPQGHTNFALDGDIVKIDISRVAEPWRDRGAEGSVEAIIERKFHQFVGEFYAYSEEGIEETDLYGYVVPQDKKLSNYKVFIEAKGIKPVDGAMVLVEITYYPDVAFPTSMQGIVTKTIGHKNDPGVDILTVVYKHGIPTEFPEEVLKQADAVPEQISDEDRKGRTDLTQELIVTIDGEDAKDLDDAVTVRKLANGNYHLGVHIADVSYYVTENSPLDAEAFERATSVYLTDRVIPMLPHRLSNGLCSLNPFEDRLTMSCEMEINLAGEVVNHKIFPSVIHSKRRMTYTAVNQILMEKDPEIRKEYEELVPMFELMGELHQILVAKRKARGAIDFEAPEAQIVVDENGHPKEILMRERGVGERLIESFMLSANETVAEHYFKLNVPFIYRIHEQPDSDRMQRFMEFVTAFGIVVKGTSQDVSPKQLQKVLAGVSGEPEEAVVSTMLLRSMKQAKYDMDPLGHFGLGAEFYTHFTSPIRRYPDLIVHRLIRSYADNGIGDEQQTKWENLLPDIAEQSSKMERRAVDAERETDSLKKTEYMADKVGEIYEGVISSVTKFGMFIELPNTIEGLIHMSNMKEDYFNFVESHLMLVGERTGVTYKIGQPIKIKVEKADVETREIDFSIVPDPNAPKTALKDRPAKGRGRGDSKRRGRSEERTATNSGYKKKETGKKKKMKVSFNDNHSTKSETKAKNGKKPFYTAVAKKKKKK
ncbi:ribonuclease R [Carnobacterium divergens]|uniref:ribonuclease R n=1 Tax=Carnobacterium divergens TaxID=2748 RepID=UPI0010724F8A|nr:ribonuclease R [Carnobacterium divergens]MDT1995725.1 ribonuclease R [Carnobacterium divergens]TFI69059.1 ribonuclease R [Carnobacterium divergens]TFI69184.1 ribonuclease R [Carnobacterium divergens]TFI72897.1 ribonuclease R [Carnobacterium divergens]TFI84020.1 ribonuclease R [Carnobacterium divergens]